MRIALVTPCTLPFACGNSLLVERLRAGLAARGHEVAVFGIHTDTVEAAVRFAPDIVHSLHAIKPALWLADLFREISVPWLITLTGTDYNSPQDYGAEYGMLAQQFAHASAIVVFHDEARAWMAEHFALAAGKVFVIAQGIELRQAVVDRSAVRQRFGISADEILFFMAAGIRPVKNICFALDVFAALRKRHPLARLLLAGPVIDAGEADRVFAKARALAGFSYIGEIEHDGVLDLMAAADIFMNVSLHEGMPGAVLEAMAEGLPVLASDAPGNRALVQHGITGLLEPLASLNGFIDAACSLAADANTRLTMGKAARQSAGGFSMLREIEKYEKVYTRLAKSL